MLNRYTKFEKEKGIKEMNILIPDVLKPPADIEREVFGSAAKIFIGEAEKAGDVPDELWYSCDAILAWDKIEYDSSLLSKLKRCKVIVRVGVGYDNIDLSEARNMNIVVCNVPDYGTEEVADHTMAFLLSFSRGFPEYTRRARQRDWSRENHMPFRLNNKVMGIIGLGRIGTATAMRAKAFGMRVIFYDPYIRDGYDKALGLERVESLNKIAERSDVISIHTPLTHETLGMINEKFFEYTKKGAILINTARGAIINLSALEKAMMAGIIRSAGLDVLPVEPPDESQKLIVEWENDKDWLRGRLIVTPHVAFYSPEAREEMRRKAALGAKIVLEGKQPVNCVNNPTN